MTINNVSGGGVPALMSTQQQAGQDEAAHHAWLRELEKAQTQMLVKSSPAPQSKPVHAAAPPVQDTLPVMAEKQFVMNAPLADNITHLMPMVDTAGTATAMTMPTVLPMNGSVNLDSRLVFTPMASLQAPDVMEQSSIQPLAPSVVGAGGREAPQYAAASLRLLKSSQQDDSEAVVDLVVRDAGMTLQQELSLSAVVRSALKDSGARLGAVWLNGQLIHNSGENHGD